MATNVVMPQLGESVVEGTVGKWLKQVGDPIELYESVMEVVTDKVTTEIPAPAAGTLLQILIPEGETVKAGTVLAVIGQPNEQVAAPTSIASANAPQEAAAGRNVAAPASATAAPETPRAPALAPSVTSGEGGKKSNGGAMRLTPVVARMISEYTITQDELQTIQGTGEGGRVSKKDLENFLKTRGASPAPAAEPQLAPWEQPGSGDLFKPTDDTFGKVQSKAPV
ncbi:MAG: biotin/lipoyl-containing protein, partial [Anaerolineae bacterium]